MEWLIWETVSIAGPEGVRGKGSMGENQEDKGVMGLQLPGVASL